MSTRALEPRALVLRPTARPFITPGFKIASPYLFLITPPAGAPTRSLCCGASDGKASRTQRHPTLSTCCSFLAIILPLSPCSWLDTRIYSSVETRIFLRTKNQKSSGTRNQKPTAPSPLHIYRRRMPGSPSSSVSPAPSASWTWARWAWTPFPRRSFKWRSWRSCRSRETN